MPCHALSFHLATELSPFFTFIRYKKLFSVVAAVIANAFRCVFFSFGSRQKTELINRSWRFRFISHILILCALNQTFQWSTFMSKSQCATDSVWMRSKVRKERKNHDFYIEMKRTHEVSKSIFYDSSIKKDLRQIVAFFHGISDQKVCSILDEVVVLIFTFIFGMKKNRVNPRHTKQSNNNKPFQEATKNPAEIDSNYKNKRDETDLHSYSCARISIWMWQPSHTRNSSITSVNQLFFCRPSFRGKCRLFKNLTMKRMKKKGRKSRLSSANTNKQTGKRAHFKGRQNTNPNACQTPNEIEDSLHFRFVMW